MITLGDRWNSPPPTQMTIFIEVPGSAATVHDLHAPMIIGARDCECKCDDRRHDHAAKHSTEEGEFHF